MKEFLKPLHEWNESENKTTSLNSKTVNALMLIKFGENFKLSMSGLIKLKIPKLVGILDNMNYFKWSKMRVYILCIFDSRI